MQNFSEDPKMPTMVAWTILDGSADPVLVFDAETLDVCHTNRAAQQLARASCAAGLELTDFHAWLNLNTKDMQAPSVTDILTENDIFNLEVAHGDACFDVSIQYLPTSGSTAQIVATFRNITQRREAERLKQELVSTVSHELRSPLTAIKGAMGLVLAGSAGEIPQRAHDMIQIAQRNADRLVLIINDILDLDKIADGAMAFDNIQVDLVDVINTAVEAISGFSERFDVGVEVVIDAQNAVSLVDPNRIVQVLVNLLSNAIKFSSTSGTVTAHLTQKDGFNRISITDTGEGIPEAEQASLFQRFVQIGAKNRAATGGTGLGLSIVQAILEKQDSKISFESEVGRGTTFFVDIPIDMEITSHNKTAGKQTS